MASWFYMHSAPHSSNQFFQFYSSLTTHFQTIKPNPCREPFINPFYFCVSNLARKRRRIEDVSHSHTVDRVVKLIGRGQLSISAAADIARGVVPNLILLYLACLLGSEKSIYKKRTQIGKPSHMWIYIGMDMLAKKRLCLISNHFSNREWKC